MMDFNYKLEERNLEVDSVVKEGSITGTAIRSEVAT